MDPKVKSLWTAALRSGEYQQAKGYLRTDDGYCCLGVLCDIAVKNGVIPEPKRVDNVAADSVLSNDDLPVYFYGGDSDSSYLTLPEAVQHWAGLRDYNPAVRVIDEEGLPGVESWRQAPLSELNDAMSFDFSKIADHIEVGL